MRSRSLRTRSSSWRSCPNSQYQYSYSVQFTPHTYLFAVRFQLHDVHRQRRLLGRRLVQQGVLLLDARLGRLLLRRLVLGQSLVRDVQLVLGVLVQHLQLLAALLQLALLLQQAEAVLGRLHLFAARLVEFAGQPLDFRVQLVDVINVNGRGGTGGCGAAGDAAIGVRHGDDADVMWCGEVNAIDMLV